VAVFDVDENFTPVLSSAMHTRFVSFAGLRIGLGLERAGPGLESPHLVADADTLNTFESRLDKHWLDQDVLYNFHSELTGTGGASICM